MHFLTFSEVQFIRLLIYIHKGHKLIILPSSNVRVSRGNEGSAGLKKKLRRVSLSVFNG